MPPRVYRQLHFTFLPVNSPLAHDWHDVGRLPARGNFLIRTPLAYFYKRTRCTFDGVEQVFLQSLIEQFWRFQTDRQ